MKTENDSVTTASATPVEPPPVKIHAAWDSKAGTLVSTTSAGCEITMTAIDKLMGSAKIPGPMDLFVSSVAGCVVHEIVNVMINTDHVDVKNINVTVNGVRRPTPSTLFDTLHITLTLTGNIDKDYAEKVIQDIMTKNCPIAVAFGRSSYLTWEQIIISS